MWIGGEGLGGGGGRRGSLGEMRRGKLSCSADLSRRRRRLELLLWLLLWCFRYNEGLRASFRSSWWRWVLWWCCCSWGL